MNTKAAPAASPETGAMRPGTQLHTERLGASITEILLPNLMNRLFPGLIGSSKLELSSPVEIAVTPFKSAAYCNNCGMCKS